jgi:hypothetical protein
MREQQHSPVDGMDDTDTRARDPDVVLGRQSTVIMLSTFILIDELGNCAI